jgi:chemotaxis signal transduction protein
MKELLLFQAGAMQLGMDLSSVMSIQSMPGTLSRQPEKHNLFAPLTEAQGISLIHLSAILGNENFSADPEIKKLIVVRTPDKPVGLIVERVDRVIKTDTNRIEPLSPIFRGPALSCFPRVFKHEGRLVLLLAPQAMVNIVRQMRKSQGNATFSAGESDPVIQQCTPTDVLYKIYGETGEKPDLHTNSGRPESC